MYYKVRYESKQMMQELFSELPFLSYTVYTITPSHQGRISVYATMFN